jgi:hypothetical protein
MSRMGKALRCQIATLKGGAGSSPQLARRGGASPSERRTRSEEPAKAPDVRREWSELGSRDIDHTTRGARVRERDAIESIRPSIYAEATT